MSAFLGITRKKKTYEKEGGVLEHVDLSSSSPSESSWPSSKSSHNHHPPHPLRYIFVLVLFQRAVSQIISFLDDINPLLTPYWKLDRALIVSEAIFFVSFIYLYIKETKKYGGSTKEKYIWDCLESLVPIWDCLHWLASCLYTCSQMQMEGMLFNLKLFLNGIICLVLGFDKIPELEEE